MFKMQTYLGENRVVWVY